MKSFGFNIKDYARVTWMVITDNSLSRDARLTYVYMLNKPSDWVFHLENIAKDLGTSKRTILRYLKELEENGLLERKEKVRVNGKFVNTNYVLNDRRYRKEQPSDNSDTKSTIPSDNPVTKEVSPSDNSDTLPSDTDVTLNNKSIYPQENKKNIFNKNVKKEECEKGKSTIDLDVIVTDERFMDCIVTFMKYHEEIRKPYKSSIGVTALYNKLVKLSNNDPYIAQLIIEQSMANNWQGIFELKEQTSVNNGYNNNGFLTKGQQHEFDELQRKERIRAKGAELLERALHGQ